MTELEIKNNKVLCPNCKEKGEMFFTIAADRVGKWLSEKIYITFCKNCGWHETELK